MGYVYFIGGDDTALIKIGYASNVARRLRALQTGSPVRLKVLSRFPGSQRVEKSIHRRFRDYRTHGEWFSFPDLQDALSRIEELLKGDDSGATVPAGREAVVSLPTYGPIEQGDIPKGGTRYRAALRRQGRRHFQSLIAARSIATRNAPLTATLPSKNCPCVAVISSWGTPARRARVDSSANASIMSWRPLWNLSRISSMTP